MRSLTIYCKHDLLGEFAYDKEQFEILFDPDGEPYVHFCGRTNTPMQPVGLKDFRGMFSELDVTYLDLSNWDFGKVENISYMFGNSKNLKVITVPESVHINPKYKDSVFVGCKSLKATAKLNKAFGIINKSMDLFD